MARLVQRAYNRVLRPHLPRKIGVWAGVPVRCEGLLDGEDYHPDYKRGVMGAIHEFVDDGDTVTLVGGGRGVSTVHCLRAGANQVIAYEAAARMLDIARETVEMEQATECVSLRHALVGEGVDIYGKVAGADIIAPDEMEVGDVLVLDCEGAEKSILQGLNDRPATLLVETHPENGVGKDTVSNLLDESGYEIHVREYEPGRPEKDVLVATGKRE